MCIEVYHLSMSRTNIEIDEDLIRRVMQRYGVRTKREAVDMALRRLDGDPMGLEEALAMEGTGWHADLGEIRQSRIQGTWP